MIKFYYEIIQSWWEVFMGEKRRIKLRISLFRYETYKDAHEAVIKIRKNDPHYRYDLGDRIYVKKCYK